MNISEILERQVTDSGYKAYCMVEIQPHVPDEGKCLHLSIISVCPDDFSTIDEKYEFLRMTSPSDKGYSVPIIKLKEPK